MDSLTETISEEAAKEFPGISKLSNEEVNRIAEAVVEKAAEDVGVRDIMIGTAMGSGAIPLYGRETRKEPCACCLIDPAEPSTPKNRMCTTKGAIGILNDREETDWCSEIKIIPDGRCARARSIRDAARECKEKHPTDTEAFFKCYIPAFSQITERLERGEEVLARGRETLRRGREVLETLEGNPAAYKVGEKVLVTIADKDIPGWIVNTKTTKDHFIRYIIKIGRDEYYEASYGQLKPAVLEGG